MPSTATLPTVQRLERGWVACAAGGPYPSEFAGIEVPATVPGSIHTDLLAAGWIPDPYLDDNESLLRWIGSTDWHYRTEFEWRSDGADRVELVFARLDTVAEFGWQGPPTWSTLKASIAEFGDCSGNWFFAEARDSAVTEPGLESSLTRTDDGCMLTVMAKTLVRDLTVLVDKVAPEPSVDRALVTLLPGERAVFRIVTDAAITQDQIVSSEVLRSANQLVLTGEVAR